MYCLKCGKEYAEGTRFCPYCGEECPQNKAQNYVHQVQEKYNVCSIVGFVLSLVSLFFSFYGILPIASVIVSAIGLKQTKETKEKGSGLAISGIIIGAFTLVFTFVIILLFGSLLSIASCAG